MEKRVIDRRNFIKGSLIAGGAAMTISLIGCGKSTAGKQAAGTGDAVYPSGFTAQDWEESATIFEPITNISEEKTYDIVVVGAGTVGMPAVLTALEEGVTVCCLQKRQRSRCPRQRLDRHYPRCQHRLWSAALDSGTSRSVELSNQPGARRILRLSFGRNHYVDGRQEKRSRIPAPHLA